MRSYVTRKHFITYPPIKASKLQRRAATSRNRLHRREITKQVEDKAKNHLARAASFFCESEDDEENEGEGQRTEPSVEVPSLL